MFGGIAGNVDVGQRNVDVGVYPRIAEPVKGVFVRVLKNMLCDKALAVELVFVEFGVAVTVFNGNGFLIDKFHLINQAGKFDVASRIQSRHGMVVMAVNRRFRFCLCRSRMGRAGQNKDIHKKNNVFFHNVILPFP